MVLALAPRCGGPRSDLLRPLTTALRRTLAGALLLLPLTTGCAGPGAGGMDPRHSLLDSDPEGAAVFVDGGFVGTTPARFFLPAKERVEVRLELPGYVSEQGVLLRKAGTPADAPEGVGWEEVYYYPLTRKGS